MSSGLTPARILIVDDDLSWQQILCEILEDMGLDVETASDLESATVCLKEKIFRVAVVDLALSRSNHRNQDGLRVLAAMRLHNPLCKGLLLTGYATVELAVSALTEHGAFSCLRKEMFNRTQFRNLIQEAMASMPAVESMSGLAADESLASVESETPSVLSNTPLALVVEDDAGWRDIVAELLTEAGYEARVCSSFGEALGQIGREKFSLAVVDLSLTGPLSSRQQRNDQEPLQSGYRVLAFTRSHQIPTIVVSGVATPSEIEQIYAEYNIFACLTKQTFNRQAFLRVVQEAGKTVQQHDEFAELTPREQEVLALLIKGMTNNDISQTLHISPNTVKRHVKAIFVKLNVNTRAAAVAKAINGNFNLQRARSH